MGYFKDVWSNLAFNSANAATQYVQSQNWRLKNVTGDTMFRSQAAYKSVLVHIAKQLAMSNLEHELNDLLPKYQRYARDKMLKDVRDVQDVNHAVLIKNGIESTADYGRLNCENGHTIIAKTKFGTPVPEALILSFDDEIRTHYFDRVWNERDLESYTLKKKNTLQSIWNPDNQIEHHAQEYRDVEFDTKTVFHIDLCPQVSTSSTKNVVLTQVQGRDYTRKELVSGGDLTYSVNGNIVSDDMGVYPTEAVKRFVKIMQYGGIVNVNFITFGVLGVKRIIIKDWSLGQIDYKNIQPYSFTCVAVEPDDAIQLKQDTIVTLNEQLSESKWDSWYKTILENKLAEMGVQTVLNTATSAITSSAGSGLDALLPNKI